MEGLNVQLLSGVLRILVLRNARSSCCLQQDPLPNHMKDVLNISVYKFVKIDDLNTLRESLLDLCRTLALKGTILLSSEGINIFVAGEKDAVAQLVAFLHADPRFADMDPKESWSVEQPFNRMLVKIKNEIIAFGVDGIAPEQKTAQKIKATELKKWLDEGKELTLLDVRNDYEVELGTFDSALPIGVDNFRDFPDAVDSLEPSLKEKPLVMFCTGGIRCEKAGPLMMEKGFKEVLQLDGGILKYFEECGGDHYDGECFVFDKRVAVDPNLDETDSEMCFACQEILQPSDLAKPEYVYGVSCHLCFEKNGTHTETAPLAASSSNQFAETEQKIAQAIDPLPGSIPYTNERPLTVPQIFDRFSVKEFLSKMDTFYDWNQWECAIKNQLVLHKGEPVSFEKELRAGDRLVHLIPNTIEPDVNVGIRIVHEDDAILVVNKPAPLAMHPCGRFNKNTLASILRTALKPQVLRAVQRLDSNTSGIVVFAKSKSFANSMQKQFEKSLVKKRYIAVVYGGPAANQFVSNEPIPIGSQTKKKASDEKGERNVLTAETRFTTLKKFGDKAVIEAIPITGRTNQIRIHLAGLGYPIVGDPTFGIESERKPEKTLSVDAPPMHLHAERIEFVHPLHQTEVTYQCPPPW